MKIISLKNLCIDRPYINLKKLNEETSVRASKLTEDTFKATYIIDQEKEALFESDDYALELKEGIEKITFNTEALDNTLLVEVDYSTKGRKRASKFKVFFILNSIKYALPFGSFEDTYADCMNILKNELNGKAELEHISNCYNSLEVEETTVNVDLNLERVAEFKDRVDYKRNVNYFVINNIPAATSKYDINSKVKEVIATDTLKVLRYNYKTRFYNIVKPFDNNVRIYLKENDIICDLKEENFALVSIYTSYGFGKLLDIRNNVIPNNNTLSLFANILDLDLEVLN